MANYTLYARVRRWPKRILYTALVLVVLLAVSVLVVRRFYDESLRPVSNDNNEKVFVVSPNETVSKISNDLHNAGLIRQPWSFERYVSDKKLGSKLQAGTYRLSPSQSAAQIANAIAQGKVAVDLIVLVPGQRIDQLKEAFIKAKFDPAAVNAAFDPSQYSSSPALADKPAGASLEGFLYPDSYQKDAMTDPKLIIQDSLKEMADHLTPDVRAGFASHGLTVYQGVTLASIVEREVSAPNDRAQVAQVFFSRLSSDMPLQSDATTSYGAILAGQKPTNTFPSAYNTYQNKGLPVGPISNVSNSSLQAVAHPAGTDWLYFVAGDDGHTHFSKTLEDHQAQVAQYCKKLCSQ